MSRALFITTSFPRHAGDFAGRFVAEMAADLTARGWAIRVLAPAGDYAPPGVERLGFRAPPGLFDGHGAPEALRARPLRAGGAAARCQAVMIRAALRHARPRELLVGHWLVPSGLAALAAGRRTGAPVHLVAHGSDVALLERAPRLLPRLLDRADGLTFVSADLAARFDARCGTARAARHVLPMGIPPPRPDRDAMARFRALAAGRRIVATVGRMVPIKGFDVLAAALARPARDDVLWIAAGDGPARAALARTCHAAGVALALPGLLDPGERDALLAVADVCVVPSRPLGRRREGTPLVVLEALAAGAPLVASRVGGIEAIAGPAGAKTVPPDDPGALRRAVQAVLDDPAEARRMAEAHRAAGRALRWSAIGEAHAAALAQTLRSG